MFIRGGYNVYPLEVEAVLAVASRASRTSPSIPRPDDVMGEIGVAVVVPADPSPPPTLDELRDRSRRGQPRRVQAARRHPRSSDELPYTGMQKVDRNACRSVSGEEPP